MKKDSVAFILFDLDGTLTDSIEGITKSIQYTALKMGIEAPPAHVLQKYIGPPMTFIYHELFGFEGETQKKAIAFYKERYADIGWKENKVYDGIYEMLDALKKKGKRLAVATNKPEHLARQIISYFHMDHYFDFVGGSDIEIARDTKEKVIRYTLNALGVDDKSAAVMVGDRHFDVEGASAVGLDCIGVTYGYGSKEELEEAGAVCTAKTPQEVSQIF